MRGKTKKLFLSFVFILALAFPVFSLANQVVVYNGTVTAISGNTLTVDVVQNSGADSSGTATGIKYTRSVPVDKGSDYKVGDNVTFSWDRDAGKVVPGTVSKGLNGNANTGVGSQDIATSGVDDNTVKFKLFPELACTKEEALTCWVGYVYNFAQGAILLLAIGSFIGAGIIYMTSAGNPKQIATAKRLLTGALSAVAVIILGRFFLTQVIGVPWL